MQYRFLFLLICVLSLAGWGETGWRLSDTQIEVRKDPAETPAKWVGADSGVAVQKRWYNRNADKNFVIVSSFGWAGIPLTLKPGVDHTLSVTVDQQANSETGYNSTVKLYAGEKGGAEWDGPSVQAGWREPQCHKSDSARLRVPIARPGSEYVIRVQCSVAQDYYEVRYLYLPGSAEVGNPRASLTGQWSGSWSNSVGESGPDSLVLQEGPSGELSGTWSGNIAVRGRRLSASEFELEGSTSRRAFRLRGRLEGGQIRLTYTAQRLDAEGSYSGESRFQRK